LLIGAGVGVGVGAFLGFADGDDRCSSDCFLKFSAAEKALFGGTVLGAIGLVTGFTIGILVVSDDWEAVELPEPTRLPFAFGLQVRVGIGAKE
jgi:hypothetical protein